MPPPHAHLPLSVAKPEPSSSPVVPPGEYRQTEGGAAAPAARPDPHRWVVFALLAPVYFLSIFNRVSPSVIATDLMAAFRADATTLGLMSSMYFWFYAVEQPVVGILTDRWGPRRITCLWALLAAAGCTLFALAPSAGWAMVGRALVGLGSGGIYVPAMTAFAQWFRRQEFATVNGFLLALGNLGAIVATSPLVWMVGLWGWRASFLLMGAISALLAVAIATCMQERSNSSGTALEVEAANRPAWRKVFSSLHFWLPVMTFMCVLGSFVTFQGLWATPYLMSVLGLPRLAASHINMLLAVGYIVGAPLAGWLVDRLFRNEITVIIVLLALETGIWGMVVTGWPPPSPVGMAVLMIMMGGGCGGLAAVLWGWVRTATPTAIMGFTTGLINPSTFVGVAVMQVVTGTLLDLARRGPAGYPPAAFQHAFLVCLAVSGTCLLLTLALRRRLARPTDPPPGRR